MNLKQLYYRIKYRPKKGQSSAIAVLYSKKKNKSDFDARMDAIAKRTVPCYKSNSEVREYISQRYNVQPVTLSDTQLNMFKATVILSNCPEILETEEITHTGKRMSRKKFFEIHENNRKRFDEAFAYPIEKLGLEVDSYTFEYILPDGFKIVYTAIAENKYENLNISTSITGRTLTEEENETLRELMDEITIYKGVSKEDIENRTPRFLSYTSSVMSKGGGL